MSDFGADQDLLGDPIPEGFGKRGRPPHIPTGQNRTKVVLLLALGWPDARIASALGITKPTLKKHYFRELRTRAEARNRVQAIRLLTYWTQFREGSVPAGKEYGRLIDKFDVDEAQRRFDEAADGPAEDVRKRPLGKKEVAAIEAQSAGQGSEWGDDLLGPGGPETQH